MTTAEKWNLLELWERAQNGDINHEEETRLNQLIRESADVRQLLAEAAMMEAQIRDMETDHVFQTTSTQLKSKPGFYYKSKLALTSVAAAVMAAGAVWLATDLPSPVATLEKARSCKWGNSALPTMEGALLPPGMLELLEGMATLKFKSGAEVVLEAPVTLEILSNMECRVRKGTVVAEVPPQAKGFTIHTPETKIVDWGTRFGVSAGEDGKCLVHVIEGLVEVHREGESQSKELRAGQRVDYGDFLAGAVNPDLDRENQPESGRWLPDTIRDLGDGWQAVTTAFGNGRDSWIQSNPSVKVSGKESFLRVKHTSHDLKLDRKAYMAFDLSRFQGKSIIEAEFVIHLEPSDLGFASLVPDASFAVYAVTDESQDQWSEAEISWENAPAHEANAHERSVPVAEKSSLLGRFIVPQGSTHGSFSIKGAALMEALRQDSNGLLTLILTRETDESARNGLAHAFASKENTRNAPPMLRVRLE